MFPLQYFTFIIRWKSIFSRRPGSTFISLISNVRSVTYPSCWSVSAALVWRLLSEGGRDACLRVVAWMLLLITGSWKKISGTVHWVHYERKVGLVLWTCSRKGNHNWRERRTEGGLEKQTTFGDVTEGSILWYFLLVYFITTRFHSPQTISSQTVNVF
jgi:hypothetical protein